MPESLDAQTIRRWCAAGLDLLQRHQNEIDDLNVFPVPDGDTGTNLLLTMRAGVRALPDDQVSVGTLLSRLARGATLGAKGNSGVILAQFLNGLAETLAGVDHIDGFILAKALERACAASYRAVAAPVEGTILSVAAAAAAAAREVNLAQLGATASIAANAAWAALAKTPEQLADLARARVLDAGGFGLALLLDALVEALGGEPSSTIAPKPPDPGPQFVERETGSQRYAYEVQYLLEAGSGEVDQLRSALSGIGDSIAVVGGGGDPGRKPIWNVHVHVNDVGAAIEAAVAVGRPYRISVTRFADQIRADQPLSYLNRPDSPPADPVVGIGRGTVVLCSGAGLGELFAAEGSTVVRTDGGPATAEQILAAVRTAGTPNVVLMPNSSALPEVAVAVATAVSRARAAGLHVAVVPTRSPVQALSALAVRNPQLGFEDDVIAMAEAAGACRHAAVVQVAVSAITVVGPCRAGDILALVDGEVNLIGRDIGTVGQQLVDRLLTAGGELVTLIAGQNAPTDLLDRLTGHLRERWPFVEVQCHNGGQPDSPLLIGVD